MAFSISLVLGVSTEDTIPEEVFAFSLRFNSMLKASYSTDLDLVAIRRSFLWIDL